jgi:hypothetical protein
MSDRANYWFRRMKEKYPPLRGIPVERLVGEDDVGASTEAEIVIGLSENLAKAGRALAYWRDEWRAFLAAGGKPTDESSREDVWENQLLACQFSKALAERDHWRQYLAKAKRLQFATV